MRRSLPRLFGGLLLALGLAAPAGACGPLRLHFSRFGQLYALDGQGQGSGIDKDLVEALAQRSGCAIQTDVDSWVRIWAALRAGSLDLVSSVIPSPEREELGEILPYLRARNVLLVRRSEAARLNNLEAFGRVPQARIVVVKGFLHGAPFDNWLVGLRAQGRVSEVGDYETALRVFAAGRAEALISSTLALRDVGRAFPDGQGFSLVPGASTEPVAAGLLLSKQTLSDDDRARLRNALAALLRDGTVYDILKRHLGEALAQQSRYAP
jgi:polar amino acid transport system substrate-binding protein